MWRFPFFSASLADLMWSQSIIRWSLALLLAEEERERGVKGKQVFADEERDMWKDVC